MGKAERSIIDRRVRGSPRPLLAAALLLTAVLAAGQLFPYRNALRDLVTGGFPSDVRLEYPLSYTIFAPFFQAADHLTLLGVSQALALLAWCNAGWAALRIAAAWMRPRRTRFWPVRLLAEVLLFNVGFVLFAAVVVLVPRPMAKLRTGHPDLLAVNTHSHTRYSHDGRQSFTPLENLKWHREGGFDANFITDHNVFGGSEEGVSLTMSGQVPGIVSLRGEELSLDESHWVVLGNRALIPNKPYSKDYAGIESFLRDLRKSGEMLAVASLPEYWKYHWGSHLEDFVRWGAHGFEIANQAPKALDFPASLRESVVRLCREHDLFVVAVTDNHGYGFTVNAWNVVRVPGWRSLPKDQVEPALLGVLKRERFQAVRVLGRVKGEKREGALWVAADPFLQLWEATRSLPPAQALTSLAWIWLIPAVAWARSRRNAARPLR